MQSTIKMLVFVIVYTFVRSFNPSFTLYEAVSSSLLICLFGFLEVGKK